MSSEKHEIRDKSASQSNEIGDDNYLEEMSERLRRLRALTNDGENPSAFERKRKGARSGYPFQS